MILGFLWYLLLVALELYRWGLTLVPVHEGLVMTADVCPLRSILPTVSECAYLVDWLLRPCLTDSWPFDSGLSSCSHMLLRFELRLVDLWSLVLYPMLRSNLVRTPYCHHPPGWIRRIAVPPPTVDVGTCVLYMWIIEGMFVEMDFHIKINFSILTWMIYMIPPVHPTSPMEKIEGFQEVKGYDGLGDSWRGSLTTDCLQSVVNGWDQRLARV